jgi:hypothetical protein
MNQSPPIDTSNAAITQRTPRYPDINHKITAQDTETAARKKKKPGLINDKTVNITGTRSIVYLIFFTILLKTAGFSSVELYGDWDESPYDNDAQTLIAVGRK